MKVLVGRVKVFAYLVITGTADADALDEGCYIYSLVSFIGLFLVLQLSGEQEVSSHQPITYSNMVVRESPREAVYYLDALNRYYVAVISVCFS